MHPSSTCNLRASQTLMMLMTDKETAGELCNPTPITGV